MGEVYRARDTKLGREVAIKILPELFAADPERLARFDREARTLAGLNHPNIAAIHGVEDRPAAPGQPPIRALIMELVVGEDLSTLIARAAETPEAEGVSPRLRESDARQARGGGAPRGLSIDESLAIAQQIARALEAAHDAGVIHRDLKPANVKVREDGTVKVLDFGLAKALDPGSSGASAGPVANSPTLTAPATQLGVIIGTAAYMAPEQARGKTVDRRADVWAFGVVLYEMLTGRRAFEGAEVSDVLASVLRQEIDWNALPKDTPSQVRRLLHRCLERDRAERLSDMSAARLEIKDAIAHPRGDAAATAPTAPDSTGRNFLPLVATALVTALIVAGVSWVVLRPSPPVPPAVIRTMIPLSSSGAVSFDSLGYRSPLAISATHVAYVTEPRQQLYLRALSSLDPAPVPGATGVMTPFFSPDGQWVAFAADGMLKKVAVAGGPISNICPLTESIGGSWGEDDTILIGDFEKGILRVSSSGGQPTLLVAADKGKLAGEPFWLPGGRAFLYTSVSRVGRFDADNTTARIQARAIDEGATSVEVTGGYHAEYVAPNRLVFMRANAVYSMPFDPAARTVSGSARAHFEDVARSGFAISRDGSLAYIANTSEAPRTFVWVDRKGQTEPTGIPAQLWAYPRISPDGQRIVIDSRQDERDLWIWNLNSKNLTRLTFEKGQDAYAVWTHDNRRIIYASPTAGAEENLSWRAADGTGKVDVLFSSPRHQTPYSLSPDDAWLVFRDEVDAEGTNLGLLNMKDRQAKPLLATRFNERNGEISPDGKWLAYQSDESGPTEIYVRPFPNVDAGRVQASSGGGIRPAWSKDSRELYFISADRDLPSLKRVAFIAGKGLEFGPAEKVLDISTYYQGSFLGRTYDVGRDGRFLFQRTVTRPGDATAPGISLVLNWTRELR